VVCMGRQFIRIAALLLLAPAVGSELNFCSQSWTEACQYFALLSHRAVYLSLTRRIAAVLPCSA